MILVNSIRMCFGSMMGSEWLEASCGLVTVIGSPFIAWLGLSDEDAMLLDVMGLLRQVYYADSEDGQTCDLAYAQLLYCYRLETGKL